MSTIARLLSLAACALLATACGLVQQQESGAAPRGSADYVGSPPDSEVGQAPSTVPQAPTTEVAADVPPLDRSVPDPGPVDSGELLPSEVLARLPGPSQPPGNPHMVCEVGSRLPPLGRQMVELDGVDRPSVNLYLDALELIVASAPPDISAQASVIGLVLSEYRPRIDSATTAQQVLELGFEMHADPRYAEAVSQAESWCS